MAYQLSFAGYDVLKMDFERIVPSVKKEPGAQLELTPEFTQKIIKTDGSRYALELDVRVQQDDFPVRIEVRISGKFSVKDADDPERVMQINATAILLPYLRSLFSMLTTIAGIPPITLPVINVAELFKQKVETRAEP